MLLQWSCWIVVTISTPMVVQRLQRIRRPEPPWVNPREKGGREGGGASG